jgi:hypothetical protein
VTDPAYHHDIIISDRSGSIWSVIHGMQDGYREFCESQARLTSEGMRVTGSLWQFDEQIECVYSFEAMEKLAQHTIIPRGGTALYDAVGFAVTREGEKLAAKPEHERPGQVVVLIASDGKENRSKEWEGQRVAELLRVQQDVYGWQVVYMGTNQDAFTEGAKINVSHDSTLSFSNTNTGTSSAWLATAAAVSRYSKRAKSAPDFARSVKVEYTSEERKAAGEK